MSKEWSDLDHQWVALERQMVEKGITGPAAPNEGSLRLNVGGSHANFPRSMLEGLPKHDEDTPTPWSFGDLFACVWDERLPRDKEGPIFLDESPKFVKHLIHSLALKCFTGNALGRAVHDRLSGDELTYLPHVSHTLGLPMDTTMPRLNSVKVTGGSNTLSLDEIGPGSEVLRGWCPGELDGLELLYRATRDGWNSGTFHRLADSAPSTVTMIRVGNQQGVDSVVGGFSSVSWAPRPHFPPARASPGAFLFILKDDREEEANTFTPVKWDVREGQEECAVQCSPYFPAHFGQGALTVVGTGGDATLWVKPYSFDTPPDSSLLSLHGQPVTEVETFRVHASQPRAPKPSPIKQPTCVGQTSPSTTDIVESAAEQVARDAGRFGDAITGTLMEERMALKQCRDELSVAGERVSASCSALAAVYGPHVAVGEKDVVIEMNVHGVRMAALRSTLQACPESSLALHFSEGVSRTTGERADQHRCWLIDCKPSVFSKVLDVLRIRKRATWPPSEGGRMFGGVGDSAPIVTLESADRVAFNDFVDTYFAGYESFINDIVR